MQNENVAIHIYSPRYPQRSPAPFDFFRYEPYTHAYFPQDHFEAVVQAPANPEGTWTFGKLGGGYVALYSYRPVEWIVYDPNEYATNGMILPFDLRANGGANNVWVVECGSQEQWGSFDAFNDAVAAAPVHITPLGDVANPGTAFDVVYDSPSQGAIHFNWDDQPTLDGEPLPAADFLRFDNPWSHTAYNSRKIYIGHEGYGVTEDLEAGTREVWEP